MFQCSRCGKKYQERPKICEICKSSVFSEGCISKFSQTRLKSHPKRF